MSSTRSRPTSPSTARHVVAADRVPGERNDLIELALRVAHAALAIASDELQRIVPDLNAFGIDDPPELIGDRLRANRAELVDLRAGQHRLWNLLELGGRHHEDHVRRRLLDRFQQRVERLGGELVDLVDDEHLVAVPHRHDREAVDDHFTDVVDAGVRGGVDLEDVDVAPVGNFLTGIAGPARIGCRTVQAVQCPRENARGGGLPDAPRPGEDKCLSQTPARQSVPKRSCHRLLPDDIVELLRPPLASDDLVGHLGYGLNRGPEGPAAHVRIYLALLPSGPDAVRRLRLHRFRTAVQSANVPLKPDTTFHRASTRSADFRRTFECTTPGRASRAADTWPAPHRRRP